MLRSVQFFLLCIALVQTNLFAQASNWSGEKSQRGGFDKYSFECAGKPAWVIVPKKAATGNPWVWRGRWADFHTETDQILLERGFHIAYVDTGNMLGCDAALDIWDRFYDELTQKHGFAKKPALEAVSRGGLFVFRWAARHPDRVACIYTDSAVFDIKSWPLGKGRSDPDPTGLSHLERYYGLKTEKEILSFKGNPIDSSIIKPIAKAKIPVLALVNPEDGIVPPEENTLVFAKRYRKWGGSIEIITAPKGTKGALKGHHFTVPDPAHAADFISRYAMEKPNVLLIMIDDVGWGDFSFSGNPWIKTPTIDHLSTEGIMLSNYHVDPTCSPSRSALMTGRYSDRVGVWHTINSRSFLRRRETTMADIFAANGYATGMFGKWHLGDSFPFRPEDRGFQQVVSHGGGGVGQGPDYFGNDYFDDTYRRNGKWERFEGYCTDIWFNEAQKFIKANRDHPFFVYLTPNAAHGPHHVATRYSAPFTNDPKIFIPEFYGMIVNIDENLSKMINFLKKEGLDQNTILIFTTDNGTAGGFDPKTGRGYDGGMRGKKGSQYDGGHRVPFMIRWPNGHLEAGKNISQITAHIDVLPTLVDLCGLQLPKKIDFDGTSLRKLFYTDGKTWPERSLVVESQRMLYPKKWWTSSVMTDRWRLINGEKLYDIQQDPKQATDLAKEYPEVSKRLRRDYEQFWDSVSPDQSIISRPVIGDNRCPVNTLYSMDWFQEKYSAWSQSAIRGGNLQDAHWEIEVAQSGIYEISLRRWPAETDEPITSGRYGKALHFKKARLRIQGIDKTIKIPEGDKEVTFRVRLKKGNTQLAPLFIGEGFEGTPYIVYITHKPHPGWQTREGLGLPLYDPKFGRRPPPACRKK